MPREINANAKRYLIDGFVMMGITDKKTATLTVKMGITMGTRYGRTRFGCVRRRISTHDMAAPYVTQIKNEANSIRVFTSPITTNRNVMKPCPEK